MAEAARKDGISWFWDLPPEVRLRIYDYCLPDRQALVTGEADRQLWFLRSNRQMYEEASEVFWGEGVFNAAILDSAGTRLRTASVDFLTKRIDFIGIPAAQCLAHLRRIRHLRITLPVHDFPQSNCQVQSVLYALAQRLDKSHRLRRLEVLADAKLPPNAQVLGLRQNGQSRLAETILNFTTQPLRAVRPAIGYGDTFAFKFTCREELPLETLAADIQAGIRNGTPIKDFRPVMQFCFAVGRLLDTAFSVPELREDVEARVADTLHRARVDYDVVALQNCFNRLVVKMQSLTSGDKANTFKSEVTRQMLNLQKALDWAVAAHDERYSEGVYGRVNSKPLVMCKAGRQIRVHDAGGTMGCS